MNHGLYCLIVCYIMPQYQPMRILRHAQYEVGSIMGRCKYMCNILYRYIFIDVRYSTKPLYKLYIYIFENPYMLTLHLYIYIIYIPGFYTDDFSDHHFLRPTSQTARVARSLKFPCWRCCRSPCNASCASPATRGACGRSASRGTCRIAPGFPTTKTYKNPGVQLPMTDPWCCQKNGVPWIPSIYPSHISINIPAPWIRHGLQFSGVRAGELRIHGR